MSGTAIFVDPLGAFGTPLDQLGERELREVVDDAWRLGANDATSGLQTAHSSDWVISRMPARVLYRVEHERWVHKLYSAAFHLTLLVLRTKGG